MTIQGGMAGSAWWLLFLGLVLSLWAARGLARALMVVSRIAWALPPSAGRATVKAALVVWGLFFAGLAVQWLRPLLFRGGVRSDLLAQIVLFGLTLAVIAGGMTLAPRRGPWTSVIAGAILMAVGLRGMGNATNVYFVDALGEKGELYGGLGLAIVIMLFLFLCSRLFVWGQVLNARVGAVTERTREIGIRKAIGARNSSILIQFLIEAIILCLLGGIIGIALGIGVRNFAGGFLNAEMAIPYDWVFIGISMCIIVGLIFGTYPAYKAANLDPIEALRYE